MERPQRRGRRARESPVRVGEVISVEIVEVSRRGDGVARVRGLIVFVPKTKPGDKVRVRIRKVGPTWAVGEVVEGEGESTA